METVFSNKLSGEFDGYLPGVEQTLQKSSPLASANGDIAHNIMALA
jgi:hypothetical protein